MASKFEECFCCPVCHDIYKDPVILTCSHSVCKVCLQQFWASEESRECPYCRRKCSKDVTLPNLALRNLCESFRGSGVHCSLHMEKLVGFCMDDNLLLCAKCLFSDKHKSHRAKATEEAAADLKGDLKTNLEYLQRKLSVYEEANTSYKEKAQRIEAKAKDTERQIKEEFDKLHQFLRDEEAARIAALREEEEQKSQTEKIKKMSREISSLSDTIRAIEKQMGADDVTFLQNYKSIIKRAQCTLPDPERVSEDVIDVEKYLNNLKVKVWRKIIAPVTLDPNTAHPDLVLSEDLTSVTCRKGNPMRFDKHLSVLGSEGFDSGTHCWDVEVGDNPYWVVGVMTESHHRKGSLHGGWFFNDSMNGRWLVCYINGKYETGSPPEPPTPLRVDQTLQRIRVKLDWDRGELSFFDPDHDNTLLCIFTHTFTERVFPYFNTDSTLRILPVPSNSRGAQMEMTM